MSQRDRIRLDVEEKASKQQETETFSEDAPTHDANANLHSMLQMQRSLGNRAVQRLLGQVQRVPFEEGGDLDDELSSEINSQRGSGGSLDSSVAEGMGQHLGYDFSDVNVHTDANADRLSRSIGARAFTTGSDIFFKEGEYQPASSGGQDLLAHELTHVVQQDGQAPSGKLSVGPANDSYEQEADSVASSMASSETTGVQRDPDDDELATSAPGTGAPALAEAMPVENAEVAPEPAPNAAPAESTGFNPSTKADEDELMMARDVQREEEEDELMMMRDVQREEEEDELMMMRDDIQRESEEDELMMKRD